MRKGLEFRKAHEVIGRIVVYAIEQGRELNDLTLEQAEAGHEANVQDGGGFVNE